MTKTRKFTKNDFNSKEGMLTSVWGPPLWHFLHTISFNYPTKPTNKQKRKYKEFINNLVYILPCKYCRDNLKKNLKSLPPIDKHLHNRDAFSRWVYNLHERVNTMLKKKSKLSYYDIRNRYESFRSRCTKKKRSKKQKRIKGKKEDGCVTPARGRKKTKCVLTIVPQETKCDSFRIGKKRPL